MPDIQRIPFYDDELLSCKDEQSGQQYIVPKPVCDIFGLAWSGQRTKLTKSLLFSKGVKKIFLPSAGGMQDTLLLEVDLLSAWLLSIDVARVREDLRDKLLRYQRECAQALRDYWTKGVAINTALAHHPDLRAIVQLAEGLAEARDMAENARLEAAQANANALRALESQLFFTVAEYICFNDLKRQVPESTYRPLSDHLRAYCHDRGIPYRRMPIGGKPWDDEYAFHLQVWADVLPGWLTRHKAQSALSIIPSSNRQGRSHG